MNSWRRASWYRDSLVGFVCLVLVVTPYAGLMPVAHADEVVDEANKGQDTAANLLLNYQVPTISNAPPLDPLGANEINVQDLFPGFDPSDPSQLTPYTDFATNPADLATQGVAQQFARQAGTGNEAEAYQGLVDGSNNPNNATIDMRNDNFLDRSRDIISGIDPMLDEILTACAEDVTAGDPGTDTVTRLEDIYTCSQLRTGLAGTCTVERDFVLLPVATQVVLAVVGGICTPTGSGLDLSDHSSGGWSAYTYTSEPACWRTQPATAHDNWNGNPYPEAWIRLDNAALPGIPGWLTTNYCGEFDTDNPTTASCSDAGSIFEHICRNAPGNTGGPGHSGQLNSNMGATGSCASYSFDPTGALYTAGTPVDYTGCTPDRQTYCEARRQEFEDECGGGSCGGSCEALDNIPIYDNLSTTPNNAGVVEPCYTTRAMFNYNDPGMEVFPQDMTFAARQTVSPDPWGDHIVMGLSTNACGDTPNPDCAASAQQFEDTCNGTQLGPAWQIIGPSGPTWPPPDAAFCATARATYEANCNAANACLSSGGTGAEHWALFQAAPDPGQVGVCSDRRLEPFSFDWSDLPAFNGMTFQRAAEWQPGEPRDDEERFYIGYYCGSHSGRTQPEIEQACNASADYVEGLCRNAIATAGAPIGGIYAITGRGGGAQENCFPLTELGPPFTYVGCSVAREAACRGMRTTHYNACMGSSGAAPLLNGTETIISPGLGPGFLEILADQNVFGTTVDFEETAFNPGDYGLAAGEYVVANHTISGSGIDTSSIDDGGSYGTNWDFTTTLTLTDSPGFDVEATLYEIVSNGFIFTGCSQADVQNVDSGACSGSITCTDYTPPCRVVDGVNMCENPSATFGVTENLVPWSDFTSTIPEMCWFADVDIVDCVGQTNCIGNPSCVADCGYLPPALQPACLADACWVDAQGSTICLDDTSESWANNLGDPNFTDDCQSLIDAPECTLLPDVACIEGMEDPADPTNVDACFLRQRFFDCGSDVTVPGVPGADDVDVTCGAQIRCLGDECANTDAESNPDFVQAAVASTTLTESTKDMTCDVVGDPTTCKIFEGTDNRCKDPRGSYLGIIPDCCKQAREAALAEGDFALYMKLALWSFRLARDPMVAAWLAQKQVLPSALQNVVNAPGAIRQSVGRVITSGFNSALEWANLAPIEIATDTPALQGQVAASPTGFGPLQQFIAGGVRDFLTSIGHGEFANSLFTVNSDGAVTGWAEDGLGEMVGNVFNTIMFIYTVYNIVKILGNIIFACEEEELSFGIQLVNRACHHVGTYCSKKVGIGPLKKCVIEKQTHCCFSSPFARIINEQLREQGIGPDWGTATEPNCDGIQISEMENVDWSLVDLSEWEAILFEAGLVPDPRNPPLNFVPTDTHPGDAAGGPEGATSTEIMTDVIGLVMPEMGEARFDLEGAPMNQPDPDLMPWYDDGVP